MGTSLLGTAVAQSPKAEPDEHLVAIRPDVLSDAEHALGNLFQRIRHIARVAREGLGPHAERLNGAVADLEALLELVFDYVTPVEVELRTVAGARVAESFVVNLQTHAPGGLMVEPCPPLAVMVDPRLLSRSFQLIGQARAQQLRTAARVALGVRHDETAERAEFVLSAELDPAVALHEEAGLAWEVAVRLIELQGGELREAVHDRCLVCTLTLPVVE